MIHRRKTFHISKYSALY